MTHPPPPLPPQEPSNSGSTIKKFALGGVIIGSALVAAYQAGYIGSNTNDDKFDSDSKPEANPSFKHNEENNVHTPVPSLQNQIDIKPNMENVEKTELPKTEDLNVNQETDPEYDKIVKGSDLAKLIEEIQPVLDQRFAESEGKNDVNSDANISLDENKQPEDDTVESSHISEDSAVKESAVHHGTTIELSKDPIEDEIYTRPALADSYLLHEDERTHEKKDENDAMPSNFTGEKVTFDENESPKDMKHGDNKIVLDIIEAIHAAEKRQQETDAYIFAEEKRKMKEKYERELKDSRIRELRDTEELAMLEKELKKEKAKAEAAIKLLQEKAEQKLQEELQRKDEEANTQLKKVQDLAKAELAAAIAREKASQIEKISEADTNISALCMAFYARSEEARQNYSVHKLALGTLALKNALSSGLPFKEEVEALHNSLDGIDKDSLIDLVLASLPEEAVNHGTDTPMQLNQKFESLKGTVRHFSLIPAGGGGLLTHAVAHVASSIKMKEDQSGYGIEGVISKVDNCLRQSKFAEAAETLEVGLRGTEAEQIVADFAKQARHRAIVEQALSVLQSYAISVSSS